MGMDMVWIAAIVLLWAVMAALALAFDKLAPSKGARS